MLLPDISAICHADDTLIIALGSTSEEAKRLAIVGTKLIIKRIRLLRLEMAVGKTEA